MNEESQSNNMFGLPASVAEAAAKSIYNSAPSVTSIDSLGDNFDGFTHNGKLHQIDVLTLWVFEDPFIRISPEAEEIIYRVVGQRKNEILKLHLEMEQYNGLSEVVGTIEPNLKGRLLIEYSDMKERLSKEYSNLRNHRFHVDRFFTYYEEQMPLVSPITIPDFVLPHYSEASKTGYLDLIDPNEEIDEDEEPTIEVVNWQVESIKSQIYIINHDPALLPSDPNYLVNKEIVAWCIDLQNRIEMLEKSSNFSLSSISTDLDMLYYALKDQYYYVLATRSNAYSLLDHKRKKLEEEVSKKGRIASSESSETRLGSPVGVINTGEMNLIQGESGPQGVNAGGCSNCCIVS